MGVVGGVGGYIAWQHFSADLPDVDGLRNYQPPVMSRVYAGDARLMAELATERRIFVPYSAIPDMVKQAFVSAEDQNFWTHRGVDPLAIARAAVFDLTHMGQGERPIGASTITQQVAKNMLLDNQVSLARKAREAILAMRIEQNLSKQRILELYLNEIYLGLGSYGVAAAAQAYFNKPLDKLTLSEAAFLAALPKAPNNYNPFKFPTPPRRGATGCWTGWPRTTSITAAQAAAAKAEPIVPSEFRRPQPIPGADWFAEEVRRQLIAQFGADVTTQGGLMVRTSLDPALQTRRREGGARRADGLRPQDGWLARSGRRTSTAAPALAKNWAEPLAQMARPPGMLPDWRLAVVLETTDSEARLGWLDTPGAVAAAAHRHAAAVRYRLGAAGQGRQARAGAAAHGGRDAAGRRGDGRAQSPLPPATAPPAKNAKPAPAAAAAPGAAADTRGAGRAGVARSDHRPGARDGRRLELRGQPVQPRDPGAAPAGLQLQAVRLSDRAGEGHLAQPALPRCADRDGHARRAAGGRTISRWTSAARRRCASRWRSR